MEQDKSNSIEDRPDAGAIQRFHRPSAWHLLIVFIATMSLGALLSRSTPVANVALICIVMGCIVVFWTVVITRQRVEISGTTVRVSNFTTFHRWRAFDAQDVIALRVVNPPNRSIALGLIATLTASPARKWQRIDISVMSSSGSPSDIDSPLFLAFFAAVQAAHPGMKVANLPESYRGALPRA